MLRDGFMSVVPGIFQRTNFYAIAAIAGSTSYVCPVSYTHLDVYKRQEHAREQAIRRGIDAHGVIHVLLGRKIAIVGGAELEAFGLLIGKALDHAHARQRILQLCIDAADLFAVVAKEDVYKRQSQYRVNNPIDLSQRQDQPEKPEAAYFSLFRCV